MVHRLQEWSQACFAVQKRELWECAFGEPRYWKQGAFNILQRSLPCTCRSMSRNPIKHGYQKAPDNEQKYGTENQQGFNKNRFQKTATRLTNKTDFRRPFNSHGPRCSNTNGSLCPSTSGRHRYLGTSSGWKVRATACLELFTPEGGPIFSFLFSRVLILGLQI